MKKKNEDADFQLPTYGAADGFLMVGGWLTLALFGGGVLLWLVAYVRRSWILREWELERRMDAEWNARD